MDAAKDLKHSLRLFHRNRSLTAMAMAAACRAARLGSGTFEFVMNVALLGEVCALPLLRRAVITLPATLAS